MQRLDGKYGQKEFDECCNELFLLRNILPITMEAKQRIQEIIEFLEFDPDTEDDE